MDRTELRHLAEKERAGWKPVRIHCCTASGCLATNAAGVKKTLLQSVTDGKLADRVQVVGVGCLGLCGRGPLVEVASPDETVLYERVGVEAAPSVVRAPN